MSKAMITSAHTGYYGMNMKFVRADNPAMMTPVMNAQA